MAKSRLGKGLADRVGWRRSADVDAEMWPEESFGGVSDEQFWDDLASDKPLTTTARTAQPDGGPPRSRMRPRERGAAPERGGGPERAAAPERGPAPERSAVPQPVSESASTQAFPASRRQSGPQPVYQTGPQQIQASAQGYPGSAIASAQGTTQAFKIQVGASAQQDQATGPQPVRPALPERGPAQRQQYRPPQPAPGPAPARPAMQPPMPPQSQSYQTSQPLPLPPAPPPAPPSRPTSGHGRHGVAEDPLTSAAYSIRSGDGTVDGRSYHASRRSRDLTREQYDAAISQETQMFSAVDGDDGPGGYQGNTPPYGYDRSRRSARREAGNANGRTGGNPQTEGGYPYSYPQQNQAAPPGLPPAGPGPLGQPPLPQVPLTQTPPHGLDYGGQGYHGPDDPGWGSGARARGVWGDGIPSAGEQGRPAVNGRDQGRATPYQDGVPYQDGYAGPGPYDPRGFDRR